MKNKVSITVTSIFVLLLNACGLAIIPGSGKIAEETRDVHGYSQIVFSAPGELTIEQNGRAGLAIEADDNLLQYIKTRVQGGVLSIFIDPEVSQLYPTSPIRYTLGTDALTSVTLNGSGVIRSDELIASHLDFSLNGSGKILIAAVKSQTTALDLNGSGEYRFDSLITDQFRASASGSGNITMEKVIAKSADLKMAGSAKLGMTNILADTLNMTMAGSGDSTLKGEVSHQSIAIHGSGSYDSQDLQSQVATVKIIGSGDSRVWVIDELNVTIMGSGDLIYRGKPSVIQTVTGSGNITSVARQ
jgi:Putative auto-transporter adhesin, head GIN domain